MKRKKVWTVYDHPADFPAVYVAREWRMRDGLPMPSGLTLTHVDIEVLRKELAAMGLVRLERAEDDDPVIMETWL
jgi:hypothetical protein